MTDATSRHDASGPLSNHNGHANGHTSRRDAEIEAAAAARADAALANETLRRSVWSPSVTTAIPAHLSIAAIRIALTAFCLGILAGFALPRALEMLLIAGRYLLSSKADVAPSAPAQRATLGYAVSQPQLHLYLLSWATFHLLEFIITARYNPTRLFSDSFLISNGLAYHLAHLCGLIEFVLECVWLPRYKQVQWHTVAAIALVAAGQSIRSLAMVHAAGNFSHEVAIRKRDDHMLVTDGVYRVFRHPSYAGFFYWALGTQAMLGNPVSVVVFAVVLWRFFNHRIQDEEVYLVHFFGQPYRDFAARTRTWIPFIA